MTIDVHPEALLDREARGELTAEERVHLDAHLALCAACRLERQLRDDFASEFATASAQGNMQRLVSDALLAARTQGSQEEEAVEPLVRSRPWAGRRAAFVLAATMLFVSGLAFAQTEIAMRAIQAAREAVFVSAPVQVAANAKRVKSKAHVRPAKHDASQALAIKQEPHSGQLPSALTVTQAIEQRPLAQVTDTKDLALTRPVEELQHVRRPRPLHKSEHSTDPARTSALAPASASVNMPHEQQVTPAPAVPLEQAPSPQPASANASDLFEMAARARRDGRFSEAVLIYRDVIRRFPTSSEGLTALVVVARLELDRGNTQAALAGYDAYVRTKSHALREQALVGKAQALYKLGRSGEADESIRALKSEYPDAPYLKLESERHEANAP